MVGKGSKHAGAPCFSLHNPSTNRLPHREDWCSSCMLRGQDTTTSHVPVHPRPTHLYAQQPVDCVGTATPFAPAQAVAMEPAAVHIMHIGNRNCMAATLAGTVHSPTARPIHANYW